MIKKEFIDKCLELGYAWQEGKAPSGAYSGEDGILIKKGDSILHFSNKGIEDMEEKTFRAGIPNLSWMTRIVGYYSRVHNWNEGKLGELKDRQHGNYTAETEFKGKGKVYKTG